MEAGNHPFSVGGKYDVISGGIPFHCLVPEVRYVAPRGPLLSRCVLRWALCAGFFSFSKVREMGACIFSSFLSVKPSEKWVHIGLSTDGVSLGFRTLRFFVWNACAVYHWQSNLIPHECYNKTQAKVYMGNQALWSWTSSYNTQPMTRMDKCHPGSLTFLSCPSSCVKVGLEWIIPSSSETQFYFKIDKWNIYRSSKNCKVWSSQSVGYKYMKH